MEESGQISINTENILPIIKRWLYSEQDIFIRELVSNAVDAIYKLERLTLVNEVERETEEPKVSIEVDKEKKQICISDTGLGMTAEEIKKYINQVAFSGLKDFVEKYQNKDDSQQIIGHFGLGFYSSFMVAERVEIETLSYKKDAKPALWSSTGDGSFQLKPSSRDKVGTSITLHVSDEAKEFLDVGRLSGIVQKYCAYMKYPVYLQGNEVSETRPLWTKNPTELNADDYKEFYRKAFPMQDDPLFWIHLNVDYPFKMRGILYFPKLAHELTASEGQVKLFCNQVYVEDNCKELIPEYLTLLKGMIDCPDLPLNVSRSALQTDPQVKKISQHITKKVADKLSGMCKVERKEFEGYWEDINPFIKYAMMRDSSFMDRMKEFVLFKSTDDTYLTIPEYLEKFGAKTEKKIIYCADPAAHSHFIKMVQGEGLQAIICNRVLDQHFIPYLEMQNPEWKFQRVDSDIEKFLDSAASKEIIDPKDNQTTSQKLEKLFKQHLKDLGDITVRVESLKHTQSPAVMVLDENMRRLKEMARSGQLGAFGADLGDKATLVINRSSAAVKRLLELSQQFNRDEDIKLMVHQIYDLAAIQQGQFSTEAMQGFLDRSIDLLARVGFQPVEVSRQA